MTMRFRGALGLLLSFAWLATSLSLSAQTQMAQTQSAAPAMQLPADQKAYRAALASPNTDTQIAALQAFLHDFPDSKRVPAARTKIFHLLLDAHPDRVKQINSLAKTMIESAGTGINRENEENSVAFELAEAPPNGVDLKSAEKWSKDAVAQLTLPAYTERLRSNYEKFKVKAPMPSTAELQKMLNQNLAPDLQTLADVYFHEGKLDKATAALDRTKAFDAESLEGAIGSILLTRGQIAAAQHHDAEALDDLERSEVYGGLTAQTKPLLLNLYAQAHGGSTSGLEADIDTQYRKLVPAAFAPEKHTAPPTGRTALLELYTGSACEPCVAADVAVDGVLEAYPRNEVVALSFDQHIPAPDPLANPDSIARADFYKINGTPSVMLDGKSPAQLGGTRSMAEKRYPKLAEDIDKDLSTPSGVELKLNGSASPDHTIAASVTVKITDAAALNKLLAAKDEKASSSGPNAAPSNVPDAAPSPEPHLTLNIALVQPEVRYSGENGVRFHEMVVRALAWPAAKGFPIATTGESQASFTFDPAEVSRNLSKYLTDFSQHNDHFGVVHFLSTDTTLTAPLAIAAWVEDPSTHQVVQAAFLPLSSATQQAAR